ncbi:MAG TPA: YncE family protein [bacterium]|nr:YncE family protein [bacterium]
MTLSRLRSINLPPHPSGGFDHGDVHLQTGRVFVAHTAMGTIEIIDGERGVHRGTIPGCPEASGVLCAQEEPLVFAAARGAGKVLVIEATSGNVIEEIAVGPRPNGLAWDPRRGRLLVADVQDFRARLVDPTAGSVVTDVELPGRPRWCAYDLNADQYLVNIRDPACVAVLAPDTAGVHARWPVSSAGPHGLDLDPAHGRAFVACDGGEVIAADLKTGRELASVAIAGEPDAIWYNADRSHLYVAIGQPGVLDVIDTREMALAQEIATEAGAHTTVLDRTRQLLYVFLPRSCRAAVYEET